nr:ATP-dependent RNA helicase HrpA [Oceanococcus sp. HetDA_MAG_MS8]
MATNAPPEYPAKLQEQQLALPDELPVAQHADELIRSVRENPVTIVCGATGSGKSTQLPKLALRAGRRSIAHTQPRRLAARTLAQRLASEMQCELGGAVGWQVRFAQALSADTCIKLMTDGILLSELRHDRSLKKYDTIIIDEAHERSLNIDFLLGCLHRLQRSRPDLRLVITSATLDTEKFSKHFGKAPVFQVEGRSYPVEIRYQESTDTGLDEEVILATRSLWKEGPGDILVFLPGEREIRELRDTLSRGPLKQSWPELEILPLYARLPSAQQQRIFNPARTGRRIILATNIAETSLTVPGIRYVIDSGLARISRFSPRNQLQSLAIEPIAQDACNQRSGRCGRTAPGICIRLYSETDFLNRPAETAPEILRSNLADVVLQMADRRLGAAEKFPFVDPPERRLLKDARRLLLQLQALRDDGRTTPTGRQMARLPVEPRYSRMLVEASRLGCLDDTVIVVAALSMPDVRDIHADNRAAAREAQAVWTDKSSDFASLILLHRAIREARSQSSRSEFERWCREHYLHVRRVREWEDLIHQLQRELRAAGFERRTQQAGNLHAALLVGLLDHLGQHQDKGEYLGPRGARWRIHPESALRRSQSTWVFAASLVTTSRTYARQVATTDAAAIIRAAGPLLRRSPLNPRWNPGRGQVVCDEDIRLFGLALSLKKNASLERHDAGLTREIFIREALVEGRWGRQQAPAFLAANRGLVAAIRADEDRLRRRDLLIDVESQCALYDQALPAELNNRDRLLSWLKKNDDASLRWTREQLQSQELGVDAAWPTRITVAGQEFSLRYRFAPGDKADGITVLLPLDALTPLSEDDFVGVVPGLAEQQLDALLRALPKPDRKRLIPINTTVRELQNELESGADFLRALQARLSSILRREVHYRELDLAALPDRLRLRFCVRDEQGQELAAGRQFERLREQLRLEAKEAVEQALPMPELPKGLTHFPEPTPDWQPRTARGTRLHLGLHRREHGVDVVVGTDPRQTAKEHGLALRQLAYLYLKSRLQLRLKPLKQLQHLKRPAQQPESPWRDMWNWLCCDASHPDQLQQNICLRLIEDHYDLETMATDRARFESHLSDGWKRLDQQLQLAVHHLQAVDSLWGELRLQLATHEANSPLLRGASLLLAPGFAYVVDDWRAWGKYVQALRLRCDKRSLKPGLDHDREQQLTGLESRFLNCLAHLPQTPQARAQVRSVYWSLQDYRVALFAQELGVPHPVSSARLEKSIVELKSL